MSKILRGIIISIIIFFTACRKTIITNQDAESSNTVSAQQIKLSCQLREDASRTALAQRMMASAPSPVVLLIDFNGHQLQNSAWNPDETTNCPAAPASLLTSGMKDYIFQSITEDFAGFAVKLTKSEQEYLAAPATRRMRCVVTYNLVDRFGNYGGLAFLGSMLWGDNTPCLVFCDVLQYNQKYIAGAISHELGHTFGLQHQARYYDDCTMEEEYHTGFGWDVLGWAPIMGISYYQNMVTWHSGPSSLGCDQIQNDMEIISSIAGVKADDYSSSLNSSTIQLPINGTKSGVLENAVDKDAFVKKETASKRIKVTSNGNSDIALEVYNSTGQFQTVYDDDSGTNVNVILSGKKYFRVRVSSNQPHVPAGDGFGGYTINVSTP